MRYKTLGKTVQKISAIGQGCMGIGDYLCKDTLSDIKQIKMLRLGIQLGMTFIDTAEGYGSGHSEELVGEAIKGQRDNVFIATKFSQKNNSYHDVIRSVEGSLHRLKVDCIDLYQVHWPNPAIPVSKTMKAMEHLVKEGKIKYIGVSNFLLKELREAELALSDNIIVSVQAEYNLFDRTIENKLLPYCENNNITIIAYSPLDNGRIAADDEKIKLLKTIGNKYGKTMHQIVLNWLITRSSVIAIPKSTNPEHIKENAAAADFELLDEDFKEISKMFTQECVYIPVNRIHAAIGSQENRKVYQTIEEAIENKLKFVPSPVDLARSILKEGILKPVKVVQNTSKIGKYDYNLIEGRIRYWAWVIAYNGKKPIPAYVRYN